MRKAIIVCLYFCAFMFIVISLSFLYEVALGEFFISVILSAGCLFFAIRLRKRLVSVGRQKNPDVGSWVKRGIKAEYDTAKYNAFKYKVVGVTYTNGPEQRQAILHKMHRHEPPFDKRIDIGVSQYDYEGEVALGVYANGKQIGNVGKDDVQRLMTHTKPGTVLAIDVYGGGLTDDGTEKNYGAMLKVLVPK